MAEKTTARDMFLRPDHLIRDEVKMYADTLRKFVNEKVLPHEDEFDDLWDWTERKNTIVHDIFKELWIDHGLQAAQVPAPYGGYDDRTMVETAALVLEVARGDHGLAETGFISGWAVASTMLPTPNEAIMKKIADGMLKKEPYVICSAISEPHGGGAVEDIMGLKGAQTRTRARLEGNDWVINGEKLWPSGYREAKAFVVVCAIEGRKFPDNIAQIWVDTDTPGVSTGKPYRKMGTSIDTNGEIWFENVRVPKENLLHGGQDEVNSMLAKETIGRAMAGSFTLGIMRRAYEVIKAYVDGREIGGMPMKNHGAMAHELGQVASDILAAEMVFWGTLERFDNPEAYGPPWDHKQLVAASVMDNAVGEYGSKVLNRCVELMGSYGYSKEGKMEKLLRDAKIGQIVVGGPVLRTLEAARYYFGTQTV